MTVRKTRERVVGGGEEVIDAFLDDVRERGIDITVEQADIIAARMRGMMQYQPRIGFLGKTGVGKSSLCNALFGRDVAPVSNVDACTRNVNEYLVGLAGKSVGIVLVDVPGVGESLERDEEYAALYRELIPKLDVLVWVAKADDRAFSIEQMFYERVVRPAMQNVPLVVAINQADKIEPAREWDHDAHAPGPRQEEALALKREAVRGLFNDIAPDRVVIVSAVERYMLGELLETVVRSVPRSKRLGVVREASSTAQTPKAVEEAERGFWTETWEKVKEVARGAVKIVVTEGVALLARGAGEFLRAWLRS